MKSFLWRLRSNAVWFLIAMAVFVGIYCLLAYSDIKYMSLSLSFSHCDPFIVCFCVSFGYFLLYTKRYSYDEEYIYGHSRKHAFLSSLVVAIIYALLLAFFALSTALLVRRSILSDQYVISPVDFYRISGMDIGLSWLSLFLINMIGYELALLFRKFKSWKFWLTLILIVAVFTILFKIFVYIADCKWFNYWVGMFLIFVPVFVILTVCDFFRTRGRQYR